MCVTAVQRWERRSEIPLLLLALAFLVAYAGPGRTPHGPTVGLWVRSSPTKGAPMGKLSFLAGMAAGYVLGAKAGTQRYEQIRRTSGKVWNSDPVQKQVAQAKEAARTKAAPVVADMVADAARATGEKLRQGRTVASEAIHHDAHRPADATPRATETADAWAGATRPPAG